MSEPRVSVLSKPRFNQIMGNVGITDLNIEDRIESICFISINDTAGKWKDSWFGQDHDNVIRLWFDDVEKDGDTPPTHDRPGIAVTDEQIERLVLFIFENIDKETFLIHCTAGISRSGAIGLFITNLLGENIEQYFKNNPRVHPNKMILDKMVKFSETCNSK